MPFGQHTRLRWWQRGGRRKPRIEQAWSQGTKVALPGRPDAKARLHKKTNTVILRKGGGKGTVLNSENMVLYKDGMLVCGNCLSRLDGNGRCPNRDCSN